MTQDVSRNNVAFLEYYREMYRAISWERDLPKCFRKSTLATIEVLAQLNPFLFLNPLFHQINTGQMKYSFSLPYLVEGPELHSYKQFRQELASKKNCKEYSRFFVSRWNSSQSFIQIDFFDPSTGGKLVPLGGRVYVILEAITSQQLQMDDMFYATAALPISGMYNSFARYLFGVLFCRIPDMNETLRSSHKVFLPPWRLVRGVGEATQAFTNFIGLHKVLKLARTEAVEAPATLAAFLALNCGVKQNQEDYFYLILWGALVINPSGKQIEVTCCSCYWPFDLVSYL